MAAPRVLIADDNPLNRELLRQVVEDLGYQVDLVNDGLQAVEAVAMIDYAVVLMDCEMPKLGGYDAARRIRSEETDRRVPILAITAHSVLSQRTAVEEAQMDGCLGKPVDDDALEAALARWAPLEEASAAGEPEAFSPRIGARIRALFFQHAPAQIDAIEAALQDGDAEATAAAAHKLKGSCVSVGVLRMGELAAQIEQDPRSSANDHRVGDLRAALTALAD